LEGRSLRGSGGNDDGILHGVVLLKGLDKLGDGGTLLTDGDVDTVELLGLVVAVVPSLLVQDGVKSDGSLSGLAITNDKFTLSTADGHHGVDGLETSLHGLVDRVTGKNTRGLELSTTLLSGLDRSFSIDRVSESIYDTAEKLNSDGNIDNLSGTLDGLALLDQSIGTEQHNTDLAGFQVHAHSLDTRCELDKFLGLHIAHTMDTSNTVTDRQDTASLGKVGFLLDTTNSLLEDGGNFGWRGLSISCVASDLF
jgi:hypothetical protein